MHFVVRVMKLCKDDQPTVNMDRFIWVRRVSRILNSDFTKIDETKKTKIGIESQHFKVLKIFNVFDLIFLNVGSLDFVF